jgi:hypothetical protein
MKIPGTDEELVDQAGRPVRDPSEIEADAEWVRARLAPAPQSGQVKTPDEVIADLDWAKHFAARSAQIIRDADKTRRAATRVHSIAHGKALRLSSAKSAELREAEAFEASLLTKELLDAAEVAYQFARDVARSVEGSTSAVQTQAAMVKVTYGLAGSGREA